MGGNDLDTAESHLGLARKPQGTCLDLPSKKHMVCNFEDIPTPVKLHWAPVKFMCLLIDPPSRVKNGGAEFMSQNRLDRISPVG